MTNYLTSVPYIDEPIPQLEVDTPALAGPGGPLNSQAQALLNKLDAVKGRVETLGSYETNAANSANAAAISAAAAHVSEQNAAASAASINATEVGLTLLRAADVATQRSALGLENHNLLGVDASGNIGLGRGTPCVWATSVNALEMKTGAFYSYNSGSVSNFYMLSNAFLNSSGAPTYKQSASSAQYLQQAGAHLWYTAPSGTAGAAISFTQAMTLNNAGRLLLGTQTDDGTNLFQCAGSGTFTKGVTVPNCANDAAAAAAGVPVGAIYRTGTTLKVRAA